MRACSKPCREWEDFVGSVVLFENKLCQWVSTEVESFGPYQNIDQPHDKPIPKPERIYMKIATSFLIAEQKFSARKTKFM